MKKIRIMVIVVMLLGLILFVLTGCEKKTSKSYVFSVDTGDKIEIKMDTTGGDYDLTSKLPIEFSIDDEVVSQGTFGTEDAYDLYSDIWESDENAKLIEKKSRDNIKYIFYEYNGEAGTEYDYVIKIKHSDTCFILGNIESKSSAIEIFNRLEFIVSE